jgi:hypothetical protein
MADREDRALADLDAYFRTEFAKAADTFASSTDIDVRLQAILATGTGNDYDSTVVTDG